MQLDYRKAYEHGNRVTAWVQKKLDDIKDFVKADLDQYTVHKYLDDKYK